MVQKFQYTQTDINSRIASIARFEDNIQRVARQQTVLPNVIKAIIAIESSGNPNAGETRTTGAKGLMQIIDQTWRSTIQTFATYQYNGQPLSNFINRDENDAWRDPELNILVGVLALKLKAAALSRTLKLTITADDRSDLFLLMTSYNAGEFTVGEAYKNAVMAGVDDPHINFLDAPYLKAAIQTVVDKFKLTWNVEAKYKEISEYAGRFLTFLEIFEGGNSSSTTTTTTTKPVTTTTTTTTTTNPTTTKPTTTTTTTSNSKYYTVVQGDTGMVIARKLGVDFSALQKVNPTVDWTRLSIGQTIVNPSGSTISTTTNTHPTTTTTKHYTVVKGDTGYVIARKVGVDFAALQKANPKVDWGKLSIGQTIVVP